MVSLKHKSSSIKLNEHKSSFKGTFNNTLQKWKTAFKRLTHDTLSEMDENTSDEQIDALFNHDKLESTHHHKRSFERDSGASRSQINGISGIQSEMKLSDEQSEENTTSVSKGCSRNSGVATNNEMDNEEEAENETFANYNDVCECAKLRNESAEPFIGGEVIFKHRRTLWEERTNDMTIRHINERRAVFGQIPAEYYNRVYKKLVIDDKPLRQPLNLQDALKVIRSGWTETKKWERAANGLA